MTNYREDLFSLRTIIGSGNHETMDSFAIVDPTSPHIVVDSWDAKDRSQTVRVWLNREQWAELAEFATKMATDPNVRDHMGSPDAVHQTDAEVRADLAEKRAAEFVRKQNATLLYLQGMLDAGRTWVLVAFDQNATSEVLDFLMDHGLVESRKSMLSGALTVFEYSLTFNGQKAAKELQK